jgi:hypothetical protein
MYETNDRGSKLRQGCRTVSCPHCKSFMLTSSWNHHSIHHINPPSHSVNCSAEYMLGTINQPDEEMRMAPDLVAGTSQPAQQPS